MYAKLLKNISYGEEKEQKKSEEAKTETCDFCCAFIFISNSFVIEQKKVCNLHFTLYSNSPSFTF